jgi:hypothetical protein
MGEEKLFQGLTSKYRTLTVTITDAGSCGLTLSEPNLYRCGGAGQDAHGAAGAGDESQVPQFIYPFCRFM